MGISRTLAALLLCGLGSAQDPVPITALGYMGEPCGAWVGPYVPKYPSIHISAAFREAAVWTWAPLDNDPYAPDRWLILGPLLSTPIRFGSCELWTDPAVAGWWRYPRDDYSTAAYFDLPTDPALIGTSWAMHAWIRLRGEWQITGAAVIVF